MQGANGVSTIKLFGIGFQLARWALCEHVGGVVYLPVAMISRCAVNGGVTKLFIGTPHTYLSAEDARETVVTLARKMIGCGMPYDAIGANNDRVPAQAPRKQATRKAPKSAGQRAHSVH